jgi:hypothetical protein
MAQCEPTKQFIVTGYKLTLSINEAQFLVNLLQYVTGDPQKTGRKYAQQIFDTLRDQGLCEQKGMFIVNEYYHGEHFSIICTA